MSILSIELQQDPLSIGYAQWIPNSPGAIADLLNALRLLWSRDEW